MQINLPCFSFQVHSKFLKHGHTLSKKKSELKFSEKINSDIFNVIFGRISDVIVRGKNWEVEEKWNHIRFTICVV